MSSLRVTRISQFVPLWVVIKAPSVISNIAQDIRIILSAITNIKFVYCNRNTTRLVDSIAKRPFVVIIKLFFSINKISPVLLSQKKVRKEKGAIALSL